MAIQVTKLQVVLKVMITVITALIDFIGEIQKEVN